MNAKERIARWLGIFTEMPNKGADPEWGEVFSYQGQTWLAVESNRHGCAFETIAWLPDVDIALWHGEDGLLAKIEERGLIYKFLCQLIKNEGDFSMPSAVELWGMLRSSPAQLTAALAEVIGDGL